MDEQVLDVEENEGELDDDELGLEEKVGEGGGRGQELVQEAALVVQSEA